MDTKLEIIYISTQFLMFWHRNMIFKSFFLFIWLLWIWNEIMQKYWKAHLKSNWTQLYNPKILGFQIGVWFEFSGTQIWSLNLFMQYFGLHFGFGSQYFGLQTHNLVPEPIVWALIQLGPVSLQNIQECCQLGYYFFFIFLAFANLEWNHAEILKHKIKQNPTLQPHNFGVAKWSPHQV